MNISKDMQNLLAMASSLCENCGLFYSISDMMGEDENIWRYAAKLTWYKKIDTHEESRQIARRYINNLKQLANGGQILEKDMFFNTFIGSADSQFLRPLVEQNYRLTDIVTYLEVISEKTEMRKKTEKKLSELKISLNRTKINKSLYDKLSAEFDELKLPNIDI